MQQGVQGSHVLLSLVAFFCIVIGINAVMVYAAVTTHSGVVAVEPYRKGLHYNERVEADERQQRLHWDSTLTVERSGEIAVTLADAGGKVVHGLNVQLLIGRPSTNRQDMKIGLVADDSGRYIGKTAPLPPGAWIVAIEAFAPATDNDPVFRAKKRLWLTQ